MWYSKNMNELYESKVLNRTNENYAFREVLKQLNEIKTQESTE